MPVNECEIAVILENGVLSSNMDVGRLVIDTGSPRSLGSNEVISIFGRAVRLNPSLMGYPWANIRRSFDFEVVGLLGVDAFSGLTVCLDISAGFLKVSSEAIDGESVEFAMGSPTVHCSIADLIQNCIIDTGAKLCYVTDRNLAESGDFSGIAQDFHPLLGTFEVETFDLGLSLFGYEFVERVAVAPSSLSSQLTAMGIGAVIGTNLISRGILTIDFERHLVAFDL
jgi:hypothetical protein